MREGKAVRQWGIRIGGMRIGSMRGGVDGLYLDEDWSVRGWGWGFVSEVRKDRKDRQAGRQAGRAGREG